MPRRVLTTLLAAAALAAVASPATASKSQLSMFQDDAVLRGSGGEARTKALDELDRLGVDIIKVMANWRTLAPGGDQKPDGFDGSNPADYSADAWAPYDELISEAQARGIRVLLTLGGLAPDWASGNGGVAGSKRPNVREFRQFVEAVGTRYSGSYVVGDGGGAPGPPPPDDPDLPLPARLQAQPAQAGSTPPRVDTWSVWNEPNLGNWLAPQRVKGRPYAPHHYRRLVNAADAGLSASGHGSDAVLIGELVPYGAARNRLRPLEFVREMACVNRRFRPFRGKAARKRGCDNFRALPGTGFAHHPYTLAGGPNVKTQHRDDVPIGYLNRLVKTLDKLGRKNRVQRARMNIWITEFGFQTYPPDPFQSAIRKVPGFMGKSEWIAWRNPRVVSHSQYLLYDERDTSGFQTGLRFAGGKAKPGVYNAYRLPFFVRHRGGRNIEVWGGIRSAGPGRRVTIQSRLGGKWRTLGNATTKKRGYFRKRFRVSGAGKRKYRFRAGGRASVQLKAR